MQTSTYVGFVGIFGLVLLAKREDEGMGECWVRMRIEMEMEMEMGMQCRVQNAMDVDVGVCDIYKGRDIRAG